MQVMLGNVHGCRNYASIVLSMIGTRLLKGGRNHSGLIQNEVLEIAKIALKKNMHSIPINK